MDVPIITQFARLGVVAGAAITLALAGPVSAVSAGQAVTSGIGYLNTQLQADGQVSGFPGINGWAGLAYLSAGHSLDTVKTAGGQSLRAYLLANPPAASTPATDWERDILVITADHQNPYSFGGTNYVDGLRATHAAGQLGSSTAVNDDAYGVLALVAAHAPASDSALVDATNFLRVHQHGDGGFSYSTDASVGADVDDTAAALAALAAAQHAGLAVAGLPGALASAQTYLLAHQNADGGFLGDPAFGSDSNVSSTGTALIALNSLGLGAGAPALAAQAYLLSTQQADGSFPYQLPVAPGQGGDTFDSAYAIMALAGGTWPQVIYDGPVPTPTATPSPSPSVSPAPGSVLGASTGSNSAGPAVATLPDVGEGANFRLLSLAALMAVTAGIAVYAYRRKQRARS